MRDKFEDLLKDALIPSEEPDAMLTQIILQKAKGENVMRKPSFKMATVIAAIAAVTIAAGGLTAYAAWQYLSAGQVAENVGDEKLAKEFQGEKAVRMNESQSYGNYEITMLGVVSGENISDLVDIDENGEVQDDKTYAVIAVKKRDGSKMPDTGDEEYGNEPFLVSPFIKGENPLRMNIFYMGGGKSNCVEDGISYHLVECDNLECFAGRGVYIGVLNEQFYNVDAYHFDEKTGEISRNEKFNGVNALFKLPLDESKADERAAEEKLAEWTADANADEDEEDEEAESGENSDELSVEEIQNEYTLMADEVTVYPASKYDEIITVDCSYKGFNTSAVFCPKECFKKEEFGIQSVSNMRNSSGTNIIILCERKKDGKIVVSPYHN